MTARMGERRRCAFLKALGETGNVTLSAERACVSRGWALAQRKRDPQFDAACDAAIAEAKSSFRLRTSGEGGRRPPKGWGHLDGVELVVKGTNGRRVQIARARAGQITPRVEQRLLQVLAATCNGDAACAAAGRSKSAVWNHRKRWPAFDRKWREAVVDGYTRIECALIQNAENLFSEPEHPPEVEMRGMTVAHAIHLLHMHKHQARGVGKAPGVRWRPPPSLDDPKILGSITRKLEVFERARQLGEADKAKIEAARREWTRRRG